MCFITADNTFRIAEKDIRCYKVLQYSNWSADKLSTPYRGFKVSLGETYKDSISVNKCGTCNNWFIEGGVFHSYARKKDALIERKEWEKVLTYRKRWGLKAIVVTCIIPKGTKYYVGKYHLITRSMSDVYKCYGSKQIKYIKEVK